MPALRRFLEIAGFAGKPSTKWAPDTVHDFMHAKITVADDISFIGSFNLSHSGEMNAENVLEIQRRRDRRPAGARSWTRSARSTRWSPCRRTRLRLAAASPLL